MRKPTATRRREVVASAQEHILRRGLHTLTIKELARANGLTEAALYRHFRSKREILKEVTSDIEAKLAETISRETRSEKEPLRRLRGIMRAHLRFTESRRGGLFVLISESINHRDPVLRRQVASVIGKYLRLIRGVLQEARRKGAVRPDLDLDDASLIFFGLVQTASINYVLSGYRQQPAGKLDPLWKVYQRGIQSDGREARPG